MGSVHVLAALAQRLNRAAGAPAIPSLYFFTDPERTPDPTLVAGRLPRGAAIVYRHFGRSDRLRVAAQLATICRVRGLFLLISADPQLARRFQAGVHWPARLAPARRAGALVTVSAHTRGDLLSAAANAADACILSPVFPTRSSAGRTALGLFAASQMARSAPVPVIALGGINIHTAARLIGRGFAGLAAIDAFLEA